MARGLHLGPDVLSIASAAADSTADHPAVAVETSRVDLSAVGYDPASLVALEDGEHVRLLGDDAAEAADALDRSTVSLLEGGRVVAEQEDAVERLLESTLGAPEQPGERICVTTPGRIVTDDGSDVIERAAIGDRLEAWGYHPTPISTAYAIIYDALADEKFTGLGICIERDLTSICLAYYGVPVLAVATPRGGDWIVEQAVETSDADETTVRKALEEFALGPDTPTDGVEGALAEALDELTRHLGDVIRAEAAEADLQEGIGVTVVVAGPWAIPGLEFLVGGRFEGGALPFSVRDVRSVDDPAGSPARGAFVAAEDGVDAADVVTWTSTTDEDDDAGLHLEFEEPGREDDPADDAIDAMFERLADRDDEIERILDELDDLAEEVETLADASATATDLDDLASRVESVADDVESLDDRAADAESLDRVDESLSSLRDEVDDLAASTATADALDALEETAATTDDVSSLDDRLDEVGSRLEGVADRLEEADDAVDALAADVDDRFDAVDDRFGDVDDQFVDVDGRFGDVDDRLGEVDDRLDDVEASVSAVDGRVDDTDERLDDLEARVVGSEERVDQLDDRIATTEEALADLADLADRVDAVDRTLDDVRDGTDEADGAIETVRERVDAAHGRFEEVDARLDAVDEQLDDRVAPMEATVEDLEQRTTDAETIASLQSDLDALDATVGTLASDVARVTELLEAMDAEERSTGDDATADAGDVGRDPPLGDDVSRDVETIRANLADVRDDLAAIRGDASGDGTAGADARSVATLAESMVGGAAAAGVVAGLVLVAEGMVETGAGAIAAGVVLLIVAIVVRVRSVTLRADR